MTPAEEILSIMERRRWNAFDLSKQAGLPPSTISRILRGSDPKYTTMQRIREAGKRRAKKAA